LIELLGGGKRHGMPETAKDPAVDKVRELQRKLWAYAKQNKTRRLHAQYDQIYRSDVLWEAWKRVRSHGGAAGVDAETIQAIEQHGVEKFMAEIQAALEAGRYRPQAAATGTPTVRDRVVPMAANILIEPIFEAHFEASSFGFWPEKSAGQAKVALRSAQFVRSRLGLTLHPDKMRMVDWLRGKGSFVYLGCTAGSVNGRDVG
jgi:hypothetical protein